MTWKADNTNLFYITYQKGRTCEVPGPIKVVIELDICIMDTNVLSKFAHNVHRVIYE